MSRFQSSHFGFANLPKLLAEEEDAAYWPMDSAWLYFLDADAAELKGKADGNDQAAQRMVRTTSVMWKHFIKSTNQAEQAAG